MTFISRKFEGIKSLKEKLGRNTLYEITAYIIMSKYIDGNRWINL